MTKARDLANIISGGFDATDIPNLDTAKITSGTFVDARLPATALNSNVDLTTLSASNLTSGTVPTARLGSGTADATTFLRGDNTFDTPPLGGITEADQWRWNAHFTGNATPITANWERNDTNFDKIGTGMSESSGVFTFPSTGIYKIDSYALLSLSGSSRYAEYIINLSTDGGSNYNQSAYGYTSIFNNSATVYVNNYASTIIDVTNVSNFKVTISITHQNTSTTVRGNTDFNTNATTFIRLGDT